MKRVENEHQWLRFTQSKERFIALNQESNEIVAYYGTSDTNLSLIHTGIEGLDFRMSSTVPWGRGNYFAEDVTMTNRFAFKIPGSNYRQIIIFKIITGKMVELDMDRSLTLAPFIPAKLASYPNERYNAVTGLDYRGRVFVLYSNEGIYPQYVVTYFNSN